MGRKGEQSKNKQGGQSKGTLKKLGSRMREIWRTTPPEEKAGMLVGRRDSDTSQQYINRPEPRTEPSLAPTSGRARPLANPGAGLLEASKTAQATEGDQVCRQYISTPHQGQAVSSPPAAARAGLLPKLSSEQLSKTKT